MRFSRWILTLLSLGLLVGCGMSWEDTYRDLRKRLAILDQVYKTENVTDLFQRFPHGFEINYKKWEKDSKYTIHLNGDEVTKEITGTLTQEVISDRKVKKIDNQQIKYERGELYFMNGEEVPTEIRHVRFLFQEFDLDKEFYERATLKTLQSGSPAGSGYWLTFRVSNDSLARYLTLPEETEFLVKLSGSYDRDELNRTNKSVAIYSTDMDLYISENIIEK